MTGFATTGLVLVDLEDDLRELPAHEAMEINACRQKMVHEARRDPRFTLALLLAALELATPVDDPTSH